MTLFKTGMLNFIAVAVKIFTGLILNKIMAVYVGPSGYALVSQFQNGINFVTTFASGAINTGVTKYTAEYSSDRGSLQSLWRTAMIISFASSFILSILIFTLSNWISIYYLKDETYSGIIRWFSITIFMFVANIILLSIVNGKKLMERYVFINISGSIVSLVFSGFMVWKFGLYGAFVSFATNQSIVFFVTLFLLRNMPWFNWSMFVGKPSDFTFFSKLLKFSLMAIVSVFCVVFLQILIRNHIATEFGWRSAGYWDGVWRISSLYLMVVTVPLSVYYLPKLSEINDKKLLVKEILSGYKLILPVVVTSAFFIYTFRTLIIDILFTSEFHPMSSLMGWQLLGDIMKLGSWLLSYIMLSKALIKTYIVTEILSSSLFYIAVHYLCKSNGLIGVTQAYCLTYFCYWLLMIVVITRYLKKDIIL
ncbi:O-antigen translocase [Yersinia kristensenii]|uniref:O-antigen translocase n=1 Tax=Yersinia kristensenii TaxID=28152 RepID=UPI00119D3C16|nr:O-antigen translocase [Yersinia kristensenii]